jgi:hypothetical protein
MSLLDEIQARRSRAGPSPSVMIPSLWGQRATLGRALVVATPWRHEPKEKPLVMSGLSKISEKPEAYLVAGTGFEPVTFRL